MLTEFFNYYSFQKRSWVFTQKHFYPTYFIVRTYVRGCHRPYVTRTISVTRMTIRNVTRMTIQFIRNVTHMTIYILIKKFLFHCNVPFLVDFSWDMSSINVFISAYSGNRQRVGWYTTAERIGPVLVALTFLHISLHQITRCIFRKSVGSTN